MANVLQHIMRRASKRALNEKGFTLVEMLAALAVLVMLTGMVAMGTRMATTAFGVEQYASQADVLAGEIENALSAQYRYTTSSNPELLVENGKFVLKGVEGGKAELLNSGAYGNCQVSLTGEATSLRPVKQVDGAYVMEGTYEISKTSGGSASREYSFYFKSYGDSPNGRAYGGIGASDDSGGSGGSGDTARDEAWAELNELIKTAGNIEQGKKYAAAFNQLQGAIEAAKGVRDNGSSTVQQLKDAKKALQDEIDAFNSSPNRPDGSGDAATLDSVNVTIDPSAQSYTVGQTGVRVAATAVYSDGNDYEYESLTWDSSDQSVVTVSMNESGEGELTFVGAGSATITATIDGVSGSIGITVDSQGGGGDNPPQAGDAVTEQQFAMRDSYGSWYHKDNPNDNGWFEVTGQDGKKFLIAYPVQSWLPSRPRQIDVVELVYYNGHYYIPVMRYQYYDNYTWFYSEGTDFKTSDFTDGQLHSYRGLPANCLGIVWLQVG